MKQTEREFCMREFRPAIAVMSVLVLIIIGWTLWKECPGSFVSSHAHQGQGPRAMTAAAKKPMTPPIDVNAPQLHDYWGTCNKCHVTTGAGKPVSKVMASVPISINQKMPHEYWGNCMLCHKVVDGFQANGEFLVPKPATGRAQAQRGGRAAVAGWTWMTPLSIGVTVEPVTQAMMDKFKLLEDNALLVVDVVPGSVADNAGLKLGDEITHVNRVSTKNVADFESGLNASKAGGNVRFRIIRGRATRNLTVRLPDALPSGTAPLLAATQQPTQQPMQQPMQQPAQQPGTGNGLLVIAAAGPNLTDPVALDFESAPYYVLVDLGRRAFRADVNPNAGRTGHGVQSGQLMANWGVGGVVAGQFSQGAGATLSGLRIGQFPGVTGSVQDALAAFQAGSLAPAQGQAHGQGAAAWPGQGMVQAPTAAYPQTLF